MTQFADLIGKTLTSIVQRDNELITFICNDGEEYQMYHRNDCCESVSIDEVYGDYNDLLNIPILDAREETNGQFHPAGFKVDYQPDSFLWTFYILRTIKGSVTIRWYGTSNGYYSEGVNFEKVEF